MAEIDFGHAFGCHQDEVADNRQRVAEDEHELVQSDLRRADKRKHDAEDIGAEEQPDGGRTYIEIALKQRVERGGNAARAYAGRQD
ncbi:hypothetical protein [Breoghania sp.]|uniref:hypothetical protein n=1 Tax=Breoghania sp. TaxID=2065378 RepID=UPI00262C05F4|nr:hypothetical protein [Breoghania sp.]MDJ0933564.1 hypothetical protein [Breoghania sp.]